MGLEVASYIPQLVASNPVGGVDAYSSADDHLRMIKLVLQTQFPNIGNNAMNATALDLNILAGAQAAGLSAAEILFVNGVTSNIQTQLDAKIGTGNDTVSNANLANMADSTIKGRASGGGTGDPQDLTAAQVLAIIMGVDGTGSGLDADLLDGNHAAAFAAASHSHAAADINSGSLPLARGGTGGTDAATARSGLGLGTIATQNANGVSISGGTVTGITDLAIADGGTGASDVTNARINLGLGNASIRNVFVSAGGSPSGGADGDFYLIY